MSSTVGTLHNFKPYIPNSQGCSELDDNSVYRPYGTNLQQSQQQHRILEPPPSSQPINNCDSNVNSSSNNNNSGAASYNNIDPFRVFDLDHQAPNQAQQQHLTPSPNYHHHQSPHAVPNHNHIAPQHQAYERSAMVQLHPQHQSVVVSQQQPLTSNQLMMANQQQTIIHHANLPPLIPASALRNVVIPTATESPSPAGPHSSPYPPPDPPPYLPVSQPPPISPYVISPTTNQLPSTSSHMHHFSPSQTAPLQQQHPGILICNVVGNANTNSTSQEDCSGSGASISSDNDGTASTRKRRKPAPTLATGRRNLKAEPVDPDEAERRQKRRERNRKSAQKCRERKVQRTTELKQQVDSLVQENANLGRQLEEMQNQIRHFLDYRRRHCPHMPLPYLTCFAELKDGDPIIQIKDEPQPMGRAATRHDHHHPVLQAAEPAPPSYELQNRPVNGMGQVDGSVLGLMPGGGAGGLENESPNNSLLDHLSWSNLDIHSFPSGESAVSLHDLKLVSTGGCYV